MKVEISNGEILDKMSILMIKMKQLQSLDQIKNVEKELAVLLADASQLKIDFKKEFEELLQVNNRLWEIEDEIRTLERAKNFGPAFVETARQVYLNNDKRAQIKRRINLASGSHLIEEKSYNPY